MKDKRRQNVLLESGNSELIQFRVWGIDPAVNISIHFAEAEGLVERRGLSYKLTDKGINFISSMDEDMAFKDDYVFLKSLGQKITERMVDNIVGGWE